MTPNQKTAYLIVVILLLYGFLNEGRSQEKTVTDTTLVSIGNVVSKIKLKLLLDDKQSKKIQEVLVTSLPKSVKKEEKDSVYKSINSSIENFLSKRQRIKFELLKGEWLNDVFEAMENK